MTFKPDSSENEPKGDREILSWILDVLTKAAAARKEFLSYQMDLTRSVVKTKIEYDSETLRITKNADLYCAFHSNLIFQTIQTIESFHGAIAASDFLSRNPSKHQDVRAVLFDPRNVKGGVISASKKKSYSPKMKYNYTSIPRINTFDKQVSKELSTMFKPCYRRFEACARYASQYWDILKPVRNVYSHNYRFVFFDAAVPEVRPHFDEGLLGYLSEDTSEDNQGNNAIRVHNVLPDLIFVGAFQRWASWKLISRLIMFERWIYQNMRSRIANNGVAVLPENVPYMAPEYFERYTEIINSQDYDFSIPKRQAYGKYEKSEQEKLHLGFLKALQDLGEPTMIVD